MNFPTSPTVGDLYTLGSKTWVWNGSAWDLQTGAASFDSLTPSQAGNAGKFLTTDGSASSWASVDALPSQATNSGKYLTTDGTNAAWGSLPTYLPVIDRSGSAVNISVANGYLPVVNRSGSTIQITIA